MSWWWNNRISVIIRVKKRGLAKATNGALRGLGEDCRGHWITFRHRYKVKFAADPGGVELPELTREVFMNVDHELLYFLQAFSLSRSPFKKTKSPTETGAEGWLVRPRALDFALDVSFCWRE